MNHLSHGGPCGALILNAHHCNLEQIYDTCQRVPTKPGVHYCQNRSSIRRLRYLRCCFPDPPHDVHPVAELAHWLPPCDQLQQHHTEAVHVALLIYFQRIGVLCWGTKRTTKQAFNIIQKYHGAVRRYVVKNGQV